MIHIALTNENGKELFLSGVVTYNIVAEGIRVCIPNNNVNAILEELVTNHIPYTIKERNYKNTVLQFSCFTSYKRYESLFDRIRELEASPEF